MINKIDWQFPNPFIQTIRVKQSETDRLGHTNNVSYLKWLESIAWEHMESLACGWEINQKLGKAMAITHTEMSYLHASYADEELILATWITRSDFRLTSERAFEIFRLKDLNKILTANMKFACIDLKTGRASKMPLELQDAHRNAIRLIS